MNLPNKLTMLRMILVPVFVFVCVASFIPFNTYIALGIFIIASFTDFLDGYIARKKKLVTNFGKFMDPLADKLLVISALICLLIMDDGSRMGSSQIIAMVGVLIIVAREFVISGFRLVASDAGVVIAASMWGKVKTVSTMIAICFMLVVEEIPVLRTVTTVLFWIAVTLTVVSLADYIVKNAGVMSDFKSKKKKPSQSKPKTGSETSHKASNTSKTAKAENTKQDTVPVFEEPTAVQAPEPARETVDTVTPDIAAPSDNETLV